MFCYLVFYLTPCILGPLNCCSSFGVDPYLLRPGDRFDRAYTYGLLAVACITFVSS
jgi:hypothetical protein